MILHRDVESLEDFVQWQYRPTISGFYLAARKQNFFSGGEQGWNKRSFLKS
jgi:hypothetical protein